MATTCHTRPLVATTRLYRPAITSSSRYQSSKGHYFSSGHARSASTSQMATDAHTRPVWLLLAITGHVWPLFVNYDRSGHGLYMANLARNGQYWSY